MWFFNKKKDVHKKESEIIMDNGLPFGWLYHNKDFVDEISATEKHMIDLYINASTVKEKISALKSKLKFYDDAEQYAKKCGKYHELYFKWMYLDSEVIKKTKEELLYMQENMEKLIEEEEKKKYALEHDFAKFEKEWATIIGQNPGILQTDLYKRYDPIIKNLISEKLYYLEKERKIIREKSGKSYKLYRKEESSCQN